MTAFGKLFGQNGIGTQLIIWQVLAQLANPIMAPMVQSLQAEAWRVDPNVPLSALQAADMVARGHLQMTEGEQAAASNGTGPTAFGHMVDAARTVPPLGSILEAYRRGLITNSGSVDGTPGVTEALTELGIREQWHPIVTRLAVDNPTWTDALDALLEGQIDEGTARHLFQLFGGNPDYFQMLFDTRGEAPSPPEALEMARRGIIPWEGTGPAATSFQQAFLEGPWRNKWEPAFRALGEYLPPARTVVALLREGSITSAQAVSLLLKEGLSPDLARAYVSGATKAKTVAGKQLTESQILALHGKHVLTDAQTSAMLVKLGYTAEEARLLVAAGNVAKQTTQVSAAVTRIRSLYVAHHLDKAQAIGALTKLGVDVTQVSAAIQAWDVETAESVAHLTAAQITRASDLGIIGQPEAMSRLEGLAYTPRDAWIILSIANKGKLPNEPS